MHRRIHIAFIVLVLSALTAHGETRIDLNGDGVDESLSVSFARPSGDYFTACTVTVDDAVHEGIAWAFHGTHSVVDIDTTDAYLEIAIPDDGPSGNFNTVLLWYDESGIHEMGTVPGVALELDGNGLIHTRRRGKVLHTWFHPATYRLTDRHTLKYVEEDLYPMNTRVTLLRDLQLFTEPSECSPSWTAPAGLKATIPVSDDESWALLETEDGRQGWFRCDSGFAGGCEASSVFKDWPDDGWRDGMTCVLAQDVVIFPRGVPKGRATTVLPAGTTVSLHRTFHEYWWEIRRETVPLGLIHVAENGVVGGRWATDIFDGLFLAD